ncbi:hypothetical protein [Streptacidiphilus sp. MAP5-3]|uniref:hypothetical protein n=1 Tax=unclassified Streptacidiphilus TaxID=2643834 RepID=UPI0035134693
MAAAARAPRRRKPAEKPCETCTGTGSESTAQYVGRGKARRWIGMADALCMDCLGTGIAATD